MTSPPRRPPMHGNYALAATGKVGNEIIVAFSDSGRAGAGRLDDHGIIDLGDDAPT